MLKYFSPAYRTTLEHKHGHTVSQTFYSPSGCQALDLLTREIAALGREEGLGISALTTHTYWGSRERIGREFAHMNRLAVSVAKTHGARFGLPVWGNMGVQGDAYATKPKPRSVEAAAAYHLEQAQVLHDSGVDVLFPETVNTLLESRAFAQVALSIGLPFQMSFVTNSEGNLLDGTSLGDAVRAVDDIHPAVGYLLNCAPDKHAEAALASAEKSGTLERLIGLSSNAMDESFEDLERATRIRPGERASQYADWLNQMDQRFGLFRRESDFWVSVCCGFLPEDILNVMRKISLSESLPHQ